ncbi:phosphoserine phosphatase SerB [Aurantimonas sp. Leaf443]|uniref:phosphoserine phosphatase SerB n=1 Tax=Aurantimonas sp. Leaf443 TaxID=1736378 RepID=UPI0006F6CA43|nr:phosphoserine phosphatase SerB [Aurantimonas sp. Leaf443]KQT86082.1 phosphoserine phosphatase [Aurantimonas sp. Leaf443]
MYVATLVAAPAGPDLAMDAVAAVAEALGARPDAADWLDEAKACDLPLPGPADAASRERAAGIAATHGFDCVVQEAAGRRKRFLIADMDSTMIEQECIDELAAVLGLKDQVAAITARAMNGEIDFEPALRERVALLAGLPESTIEAVIAERITLMPGGRTLVATMRAKGAHTALVSGGFTAFTGPIAAMIGFHETRANILHGRDGTLTGTVAEPILGAAAKVDALDQISTRLGLTPADALAVGDGANDLPMLLAAGTGIACHAKPSVAARAPHRVDHGDLTALLFVQGYRRSDFVD